MLKKFLLQSLFCFFVLINFSFAFALSTQDKQAIEKTVQDYTDAWNERACKGFADAFTNDADFVNIFGMQFSGKFEIENRHIAILQSFLKDSKLKILNIKLREVKSNLVIAHILWKLDGYRDPGADFTQSGVKKEGIYTQVFLKEENKWVITASQNTLSLQAAETAQNTYFDNTGRDDVLSGGVKLIPITTPKGKFNVWTKRIGNNPKIKVLLLHGGPGATHEYLEAFDSFFPGAGIEYYYYDQLGSYYSDQPKAPELWDIPRFVDEVEQVRQALHLDKSNFYLYGQSWGGALALEYALKYQQNLKGLIISNMMSSIPAYNKYAKVLMSEIDPKKLAEIKAIEATKDYENPRYMELLIPLHYEHHLLRMPVNQWPEPMNETFKHLNHDVYIPMQGPSELGASGKMLNWDRTNDLPKITVPTLMIGAKYDTMDPAYMKMMSQKVQKGSYLFCPKGSHLALYDDQDVYMKGIIQFLRHSEERSDEESH